MKIMLMEQIMLWKGIIMWLEIYLHNSWPTCKIKWQIDYNPGSKVYLEHSQLEQLKILIIQFKKLLLQIKVW